MVLPPMNSVPSMSLVLPEQQEGGPAGLSAASHRDGIYYRSREPHPDWIRALRDLSPVTDAHGYLLLVWEPGEPWNPWQRWMLYEGVRPELVFDLESPSGRAMMAELNGPHPRSEGHMCHDDVPEQFLCTCRDARGRIRRTGTWRGGPTDMITLRQYQLYRETGLWCNPFWVVQGDLGGHQFNYDGFQRRLMVQHGLEPDPPRIGSLPYAEPDGRVWRQIIRYNRLIAMDQTLSEYRQTMGEGYGAYKAEIEKDMRRQFVSFLADQTREEADLFISGIRKGEAGDVPRTDTDWERVDELSSKDYIETGVMNHTSAYLPKLTQ